MCTVTRAAWLPTSCLVVRINKPEGASAHDTQSNLQNVSYRWPALRKVRLTGLPHYNQLHAQVLVTRYQKKLVVAQYCHKFHHLIPPRGRRIQTLKLYYTNKIGRRSQLPRGLGREFAAACLLGLRVRIPQWAWKSVCCKCCVLSGRILRDGPIARPEESNRFF